MREKEEIIRGDESIFPYKILKFRAAEIVDEKTDIEAAKDRIVARLTEQIKPYVVFENGYTNPKYEETMCYPVIKGDLFVLKIESEEKDMEAENTIRNLERWTEVTRGLYRYVISAGACYEIHILYHAHTTPIETAKASLYIVGDWRDAQENNFFERECLLSEQPVSECLKAAQKDFVENCEEE